jgi:glutathione synthase
LALATTASSPTNIPKMSSGTTSVPPVVRALPLDALAVTANAYAAAHGIQVEKRVPPAPSNDGDANSSNSGVLFQCAPMSLLPNAYPRAAFDSAVQLAPSFNVLVDRISRDADFLQSCLGGSVASADPYTAKLLHLFRSIYCDSGNNDNINAALTADRLGIHRSDYMLHRDNSINSNGDGEYVIKQVELNTIAASFAGLACKVANLHSYLVQRYANDENLRTFLLHNQVAVTGTSINNGDPSAGVPVNPTLERLPAAMNVALVRYKERFASAAAANSRPLVVLFVVQEGETNTVDQRLFEFQLFANHGIPVVRMSLRQVQEAVEVTEEGALTYQGNEIAIVYYRAGYAPTDFPGGDNGVEWQAREKLERSRATKCPSLGYHLAGTKKVQQELARLGVLERFFPNDAEQVTAMRAAFAGLYSLGDDAGEEDLEAVRQVLAGGEGRYVLKPQREGGGYNFYGARLAARLRENTTGEDGTLVLNEKLGEYILMERLFPPQQTAILLRSGRVEGTGESISELGCFGTLVVSSEGEVLHNEYAGFLLRTKFSNIDEGGVASGFATLSSPYLC